MKIAVDFDGVICKRKGVPRPGSFVDSPPTAYTKEAIEWLQLLGHDLYICTNRNVDHWSTMKEWLKKRKLPDLRITNRKEPGTSVYIDDRAIRFTNWQDICKYFG